MPEVPQPQQQPPQPEQPQQPATAEQPAAPQPPEQAEPEPAAQAELYGANEVLDRESPAPDVSEAFEKIAEGSAAEANDASTPAKEGGMPLDPFTDTETQQVAKDAEAALGLANEPAKTNGESTQTGPENPSATPPAETNKPAEALQTPDPKDGTNRRGANDTAERTDQSTKNENATDKGKPAQNDTPEGPEDPFTPEETAQAVKDAVAETAKASATEKFDKLYNLNDQEKAARDSELDARKASGEWDGNDNVRKLTNTEMAARQRVVGERKEEMSNMVQEGLNSGKNYEQINQELENKYLLSNKLSTAEVAQNQQFLNEVKNATKNMAPAEYNKLLQDMSADPDTGSLIITVQEIRKQYETQVQGEIVQFTKKTEQAANQERNPVEKSKLLLALKILLAILGVAGAAVYETAKATAQKQ
jgi:hypothetical protein